MSWGIEAPAKINLTLEVLGILPGGYHELDTIFASLAVADRLEWSHATSARLRIDAPAGGLEISCGEDNLVMRALRLLERACGRALPLDVYLRKLIPAAGGLGGGSSDAAALLYGVNDSEQLGFSGIELELLAAELGADVAFCVHGGTARGTHRGEQLSALPAAPALPVALLFPPFGCPTGEVYRCWDRVRASPARGSSSTVERALVEQNLDDLLAALGNDLQPVAEELWPELRRLGDVMLDCGARQVLLSGSGSTLLGFGADEGVVEELTRRGHRAVLSKVQGSSARRAGLHAVPGS